MNVIVLARCSALPPDALPHWVSQLTAALRQRGQTVAMVDGSMQCFPPKIRREDLHTLDIESAWQAGAQEVLLAHAHGAALLTRFDAPPAGASAAAPDLFGLVSLLDPRIDWVLALGFDQASTHKLEFHAPNAPERPLYPDDPFVAALVVPDVAQPLPEATLRPVLPLHEPQAVADWLLTQSERFDWATQQGGGELPADAL